MHKPIQIDKPERVLPDSYSVKCPIELDNLPVTEDEWKILDLQGQVNVIREDQKYLIKEYKKCALRQNKLVDWNLNGTTE